MTRAQKPTDPVTFEECEPFLRSNREDALPVQDLLPAINAARTKALPPREETSQGALTAFLMDEASKTQPRIGVVKGRRNGYYLLQTLPTQASATAAEPPEPSQAPPVPEPVPVAQPVSPAPAAKPVGLTKDSSVFREIMAVQKQLPWGIGKPAREILQLSSTEAEQWLAHLKSILEERERQYQKKVDAAANANVAPLREQLANVRAELVLADAKANNLNECWNEATGQLEDALNNAQALREQIKKLGADLAASKKRLHGLEEAQKKPVETVVKTTAPAASATPPATSGSEPGPVIETPELRSEVLASPLRVDRPRRPNAVMRFLSNGFTIAAIVVFVLIGTAILVPKAFQGTKSEEGKRQEEDQKVVKQVQPQPTVSVVPAPNEFDKLLDATNQTLKRAKELQ